MRSPEVCRFRLQMPAASARQASSSSSPPPPPQSVAAAAAGLLARPQVAGEGVPRQRLFKPHWRWLPPAAPCPAGRQAVAGDGLPASALSELVEQQRRQDGDRPPEMLPLRDFIWQLFPSGMWSRCCSGWSCRGPRCCQLCGQPSCGRWQRCLKHRQQHSSKHHSRKHRSCSQGLMRQDLTFIMHNLLRTVSKNQLKGCCCNRAQPTTTHAANSRLHCPTVCMPGTKRTASWNGNTKHVLGSRKQLQPGRHAV